MGRYFALLRLSLMAFVRADAARCYLLSYASELWVGEMLRLAGYRLAGGRRARGSRTAGRERKSTAQLDKSGRAVL